MGTQNVSNTEELLHGVLSCAGGMERLSRGLDRLSDASELPFNHYEAQQLADSVRCVERLIVTAEQLVGLQLQRWGL